MKARRELTAAQIQMIKEYKHTENDVRFSKSTLQKLGLPREGGGLVRVNGGVYTFICKLSNMKNYKLGTGDSGTVKLLQNTENSALKKALKVICEKDRDKFAKELSIAAELGRGSPQIMSKIKIGDSENSKVSFSGALDLMPGISIGDLLRAHPETSIEKRLKILTECVIEVYWLHKQGYAHGDAHEDNFMYDHTTDTVKLVDFGCTVKLPQSKRDRKKKIACDLYYLLNNRDGIVKILVENEINYNDKMDFDKLSFLTDTEKQSLKKIQSKIKKAFLGNGKCAKAKSAIRLLKEILEKYLVRQNMLNPHVSPNISNESLLEKKAEVCSEIICDTPPKSMHSAHNFFSAKTDSYTSSFNGIEHLSL
jgi:hypothetical protein